MSARDDYRVLGERWVDAGGEVTRALDEIDALRADIRLCSERRAELAEDMDQALAALWKVRILAEQHSPVDDPRAFVQQLIWIALNGMGPNKARAQSAAALKA